MELKGCAATEKPLLGKKKQPKPQNPLMLLELQMQEVYSEGNIPTDLC